MQKSYLVKQSVDFGQVSKFLIRPGDILVFDSANQSKVTVYRSGEIMKVLPNQSLGGLNGLAKSGWITEIHANDSPKPTSAPAKIPPRVGTKSPVPAPKSAVVASSSGKKPLTKSVPDSTI